MAPRFLLIVAALLLAGGLGFLLGRPGLLTGPDADASRTAAADAQREATPAASPRPARVAAAAVDIAAPLPDLDTPLAQIHDDLVRRAANGEARAACRLAVEHQRCETGRTRLRSMVARDAQDPAWQTRRLGTADSDEARAHVEAMRVQQLQARSEQAQFVAQCDEIAPLSPDARARYWRQAALAGHVPSMRHYAIGNAFRWHDLMDALPALQTYRREAEAIARRAAMQGDAASIYALAMAYADSDGGHWRPFLAQTTTPDLAQSLAWFSVLARHPAITTLPPDHPTALNVARQLATLQAAATASESARAAQLTAAVVVPDADSLEPGAIRVDGGIDDIEPGACSDTRFAASTRAPATR
ncbi:MULTISPECIES: hypothetical protein [Luteimonas]|uniref:hypothetical protein n=1 Tax=Luteimonas TaxID=83614 RepID=UPI000C7BE2C8|nr:MULTISPECIES: hypothetical protein [Luteimonas]